MPRKATSVPKKSRAPKPPAGFSDTPRLMSDEEKHRLIMAHAAARAPQDPLQRVSLWAGVTLSVAAIAVGWWFTVGYSIRENVNQGSEELRRAAAELDKFTEMVQTSPALDHLTNQPTSEANAESFDTVLQRNLFAPSDHVSSTNFVSSTASAPSAPPGLTPDP